MAAQMLAAARLDAPVLLNRRFTKTPKTPFGQSFG